MTGDGGSFDDRPDASIEGQPNRSTGGGADGPIDPDGMVLFEETLSLDDESGSGSLVTTSRLLFVGILVVTVGGLIVLVASSVDRAAVSVGGMDQLLVVLRGIAATRPLVLGGVVAVILFAGLWILVSIVGMGLASRRVAERVSTLVTEDGVSIHLEGGRPGRIGRSRAVDIPFDDITAVEYLDPDASSFRVGLRDWRAPKFFAGRRETWVRIGRAGDRAVYVGSDRPMALADTLAPPAPEAVDAEPY
jgi:hypothetical protein